MRAKTATTFCVDRRTAMTRQPLGLAPLYIVSSLRSRLPVALSPVGSEEVDRAAFIVFPLHSIVIIEEIWISHQG